MIQSNYKWDIDSHGVFLSGLIKDIRSGQLVPAAFQRPYVWTKKDVLALIKSIMNGFPIGSFLYWSPWGAADISRLGRRRLGPVFGKENSISQSLLLDGQNRLATMAWIMRKVDEPMPDDLTGQEKETWGSGEQLVLDFATWDIKFVPDSEINVGFRMPLSTLFNGQVYPEIRAREKTQWAGVSDQDFDKAFAFVDEAVRAFREARVVVTDIKNATVDQAKEAFLHICKLGVPMSEADFDAAVAWTEDSK